MKAFLKNYRQSPRKVRAVAGLVCGKNVDTAMTSLDFLVKRAGMPIKKLLSSAIANAKQMGIEKENLIIKELRVDKGVIMKRMMPAAMGTGHRINKRTSHITIVLAEKVMPIVKVTKKAIKTDKSKIIESNKIEVKTEKKPIIKNTKKTTPKVLKAEKVTLK
jgi:large subunit ribosomal protein L22